MGIILQYLWAIREHLLAYKSKLLLAAVLLFSPAWTLFSPIKGIEGFILALQGQPFNLPALRFQAENEQIAAARDGQSSQPSYFVSNTLASLSVQNQTNSAEPESQPGLNSRSTSLSLVETKALLSSNQPITTISQEPRQQITTYVVKEGDTPSTIAASFGLTSYTLLWANNLKETSIIRPGDELTIPPVNGVIHRVRSGETISSIAQRYRAEAKKIIAFNDLPADGSIQIGQELVVPDGQMPLPKTKTYAAKSKRVIGPGTGKSRAFPWGQCTWYVAQKRYIPWSGHAKYWLANARKYGFSTGSIPQVGAVMVTRENGWYGHVAYVEAINGPWITISEMNYLGLGIKSVRTLHQNNPLIRGYIY